MRNLKSLTLPIAAICLSCISALALGSPTAREIVDLDFNWRFQQGDTPSANNADFDDSHWRTLNVPHDWAAEATILPEGAQSEQGGYSPGGVGWYRRVITVPKNWEAKHVRIEFDGVYMNSEVWINGVHLGKRPYGYISFGYELTKHLHAGNNVIAVRVDNSKEPSTRWRHGCGIYGHVKLVLSSPVNVASNGIWIQTPSIDDDRASVEIQTVVIKGKGEDTPFQVRTSLLDPSGNQVATSLSDIYSKAVSSTTVQQVLTIAQPMRWDVDTPHLYQARTEILRNGEVIDSVLTRFGLRTTEWEKETGFWLNGRNLKIQGVCEHLEGGPVGAAWPDSLIEWKLRLLKDMGCNAIRTAHNPQVPKFYELCDELGLLVMDEIFDGWKEKATWDYGRQAFDQWWQRDLEDWIRRDRNHPCVVIWSVGNETGGSIGAELVEACRRLDPTRPVTSGHSSPKAMDVLGVNGASEKKKFFGEWHSKVPFIATEAPHTWQVRGFYRTQTWYRDGYPNRRQDPFDIPDLTPNEIFVDDWIPPALRQNDKQVFNSSYDNATVRINARRHWELTRDLPWLSGHFRWTGFDYPGESGYVHGGWPFRAFMGGVIDLAGFPKDLYYFYQSQWSQVPVLHILPHWTHPRIKQGTLIPLWVYSNADEVELLLNGKSLGKKRPGKKWDQMQCEWFVPWRPGTITAIGYREGQIVSKVSQRSSEHPSSFDATIGDGVLAANGRDVTTVSVSLADSDAVFYPYGENRVTFHVEGPIQLLAIENGNPIDVEPTFGVSNRRAFYGRVRAFVQSTRTQGNASIVVGAILGERRQITSNEVSIEVRRLTLRGEARSQDFSVHYSIDGASPNLDSPVYSGPFAVPLGTTVRAAVFEEGKLVFEMQERFAHDVGLHWGTSESLDPDVVDLSLERTLNDAATTIPISPRRRGHHSCVSDDLPKTDRKPSQVKEARLITK